MGSCSNCSVQLHKEDAEHLKCKLSRLKRGLGAMTMGSCSNSSVQLQKKDMEHLRCKLSRLKRAGELYDTGSDRILLVLWDNGFVFKQLCSAPEDGHRI